MPSRNDVLCGDVVPQRRARMGWNQNLSREEKFSWVMFAICPLGTADHGSGRESGSGRRRPMSRCSLKYRPPLTVSQAHRWSKIRERRRLRFLASSATASATVMPPTPSPASAAVGFNPEVVQVTSAPAKLIQQVDHPARETQHRMAPVRL